MGFVARLETKQSGKIDVLADPGALRAGVLVAFTGRRGGVSRAPFDTLNLAMLGGDERADVEMNRGRAARACGFEPARLALARQTHETALIEVGAGDAGVLGEADGLVIRRPGPVAAILTADCAPVVVAGDRGVAVLHGGWRGLVTGVVEAGVGSIGEVWGAWVGPCIRSCCYEVGPEVVVAFKGADLPVAGDSHVDIAAASAQALRRAGVASIAVSAACTHCDPGYFSYRRDGRTGRQGAFAGLVAP